MTPCKHLSAGLVLASALATGACTTRLPVDTASGTTVRQLLSAQARPPAPATAAPGLDGVAARAAIQRYEQSFQTGQKSDQPLVGESRAK